MIFHGAEKIHGALQKYLRRCTITSPLKNVCKECMSLGHTLVHALEKCILESCMLRMYSYESME